MPRRLASRLVALASFAGTLGLAAPALAQAGERADLLTEALGADATPLSDAEMGDLRAGAGLFGLPFGSSTFAQIGGTTTASFSPGNPSSASSNLTDGSTTLSATASIGPAGPPPSLTFTQTFGATSSVSITHSFSFPFAPYPYHPLPDRRPPPPRPPPRS